MIANYVDINAIKSDICTQQKTKHPERRAKTMRATVRYKDFWTGNAKQKTFETAEIEINKVVRNFIAKTGVSRATYIKEVKIGNRIYDWKGKASGAYAS